ncbi:MAG: hypothetical protein FWG11_03730 [Promicromonosporaceae bacterium]|nr:hypothetical protein [Promicromonosporaceae bacterium]
MIAAGALASKRQTAIKLVAPGSTDSELWPAELAQAEALVESKFATDEWQNRVP